MSIDLVEVFNVPPYFAPESVEVQEFDRTNRAYVNLAADNGTVRMFIVQDSPEMRQTTFQWAQFWGPTNTHYDYFATYHSYDATRRAATVRKLVIGDRVVSSAKGTLQVVFVYNDFPPAQLVWLTKVPATDPIQAPR